MLGSNGIECTSPSFQFGGTYFGSCPGNTSPTCIVSYAVGHDAPWLHRENGVPPPPEGPFLHTIYLGEILLDF